MMILQYFRMMLCMDAFKTSLVETVWNQNPTGDERSWGVRGYELTSLFQWFSSSLFSS